MGNMSVCEAAAAAPLDPQPAREIGYSDSSIVRPESSPPAPKKPDTRMNHQAVKAAMKVQKRVNTLRTLLEARRRDEAKIAVATERLERAYGKLMKLKEGPAIIVTDEDWSEIPSCE